MHILVVNDDGPPTTSSSPYVLDLVRALQRAGHTISVVLPHQQRSWIGKAHILGQNIKPYYYQPPPAPDSNQPLPADISYVDTGKVSPRPLPSDSTQEEWVLIDSTPASCVQIGLHHYFKSRGPIDLVISGPNYGRNTTAVFALSSGTLGAALEAAICGVRAIALSYAFFDRNHDPKIIKGATNASIRVINALVENWDTRDQERGDKVQIYSVNVPLLAGVEKAKALWTQMLQNTWRTGSCFTEMDVSEEEDWAPGEEEEKIREAEGTEKEEDGKKVGDHMRYTHKQFKWSPKFTDVYKSVEEAPPGNDGWAVQHGHISVTPLKANFMHVRGFEGEIEI
ncbi:sure-like protein [Microthyrium microscopicum]|uniref:Sure-like protein n=1 Tax=Microthyrium microscopicum TaxID=703497 RepID=A0A6A6UG66_9PEZI|nr:sure-like protein [Microthyrium microscopicum]